MQLRITPNRHTGLSPAVALLGRQLRDFLPVPKQNLIGDMWTQVLGDREEALAKPALRNHDKWSEHTKPLHPYVLEITSLSRTRWVIISKDGIS